MFGIRPWGRRPSVWIDLPRTCPGVETTIAAFDGDFTPRTIRAEAGPAALAPRKGAQNTAGRLGAHAAVRATARR